jgi:ribosomal protein S12 methylthiotransferase accessory factor
VKEILQIDFPGGKKVDIKVGGFVVKTDQAVKAGGDASAPEPFDLFLASIAGCAGIFALNFCLSRNLSTEGLGLSMDWEREDKRPMEAKARFRLVLPDGFPDKYRPGIVKAMELCTVKRYLNNPPAFSIEIED